MTLMKHLYALPLLLLSLWSPLVATAQGPAYLPGELLVMLKPGEVAQYVADDLQLLNGQRTGLAVAQELSAPMRTWLLRFDATVMAQQEVLRAVSAHPAVMLAQNNHVVTERQVPNDTQYGQQWHHQNINSEAAWEISTGGVTATGDSIVVCIIETADLPHADLTANAWRNLGEVADNNIDDDQNGYVDDRLGWNPPGNNDAVFGGGHGTQVAGMIGAKGNNASGVAGANWNVKMMVVNYGGTSEAQVVAAYTYPLVMRRLYTSTGGEKGAFVVATNASWGIDNGDPADSPIWCAMYDTLGTAGILSCGATANNNVNVDVVGDLPTACASDFMISVTATNNADVRTFSGYGLTTIDVGAPGENVRTTSIGGGYGSTSGTSFASPLTAGVIGLLYSAPCPSLMALVNADPAAGALYIRQMLFEGVDAVGNLGGQTVTGGRINAGTSMELLMAGCSDCAPPFGAALSVESATSATYTWNTAADGPYSVRYRPQGTTEWTVVEGLTGTSYTATDLEACTAYEFQAEAACSEGSSGFSPSTLLVPELVAVPTVSLNGRLQFCEGGTRILSSSAPTGNVWSTGDTGSSLTVNSGGTYTVTVSGACNSETSAPVTLEMLPTPTPVATDVVLTEPGTATLTAEGDSIRWYANETGGASLGSGSPWQTPFLNSGTTYWVSNTVVSPTTPVFGAKEDRTTTGAFHTNGSFWVVFTATEAFTIRSVKVYANGAGSRPIGLVNMPSGGVVTQGSFALPNGESRVDLNFQVPGPGQYGLRIMSGDPQLWRDGIGSNPGFPFALGTVGTITGTTATGSNATALYYFFYDWEVEPLPLVCESPRVPVNVDLQVGMTEATNTSGVIVYPHPADNELTFELKGSTAGQTMQLMVTDNAGRRVATRSLEGARTVVSTSALANGLYTYRVAGPGGEVAHGTFVVAHP
jgi:hypothetical protein